MVYCSATVDTPGGATRAIIPPSRIKHGWEFVEAHRRELLDHVVIFNQLQLHRLLAEYVRYHHEDRCHLALGMDTPDGRVLSTKPSADAQVVALPRVGGWQHRYEWRLAA